MPIINHKSKIVLLLLFLFSQFQYSQGLLHYTIADGLSGADVTAICENENFLWFATNEGLSRFDGREFVVYKKITYSENSLSGNNIETLMFDSNGMLWIGLKTGGVDIYDPRNDQFTHISKIVNKYPDRVISIFEDTQKNIWLGSWEEGIYKLEPTADSRQYNVNVYLPAQIVSTIIEKPQGILWVGTYDEYHVYNMDKKQWYDLENNELHITQLYGADDDNNIWCTTWDQGLWKFNWSGSDFSTIRKEQYLRGYHNLFRIYSTSNARLYLGTWGEGLKKVETGQNQIRELTVNTDLKSSVILCFFRDRYNKFWVGTYGNGLYRLNTEEEGINILSPINRNGLSAAYKVEFFGENYLVIGTQGDGLYLYDLKNKKLEDIQVNHVRKTLFNNFILSLYCEDQLLIVGHDDFGIYYYSFDGNKNADLTLKQFFASDQLTKVTSVFKDKNSTIWLGTKQNGLSSVKYNSVTKTFDNYVYHSSFVRDEITGFATFNSECLWVSSHSGMYLFNTASGKLENDGRPLFSDMVYEIADDSRNSCLWLGTSVGLWQIKYNETQVRQVFPSELLPEEAIYNLSLDSENNLWFSIADRIFCLVNDTGELKEINTNIFGNQFNFSSAVGKIDNKGYVLFGGSDRLLLIDHQTTLQRPDQTKIVLTGLQIDHQRVIVGEKIYGIVALEEAAEYVKSISLSYKSKWISLSLSEIGWDYFRNQYQYRIEGFSDAWQYFDISKPLTFSQLKPGEYTLFIRHHKLSSDNDNDNYNDNNNAPYWSLQLNVIPPWWQTWWFYSAIIIIAMIIIVIAIITIKNYYKERQRLHLKEIEKRKKEELLQEKENFFAGLSHDLMTPFSLIIAPANDLLREKGLTKDKMEKIEIISRNASFLSDIFSSIFDLKRAEVDTQIKEKAVELVSFCRIIVNVFDYLAKSKNITLDFISGDADELNVWVDTVKLERIIYNLLSNALKFTPDGGKVQVSLEVENEEKFVLKIADTGAGIIPRDLPKVFDKFYQGALSKEENSGGLGLGLFIVRNFAEMMGGYVGIESETETGTTITVCLPIKRNMEEILDNDKTELSDLPSILLVEDNSQLRTYLKKKFSLNFQVTTATNGNEALEFIRSDFPEMVISDVMMPEMDGLELCRTIKSNSLLSDIFVVMLSAKSSTEDELQGYEAGADLYLKKPFDSDILVKQVMNVYFTRQQRKRQIMNKLITSLHSEKNNPLPEGDLLGKAIKVIEEHLMDENFKIDEFAAEMCMSKTVLHRKFKAIIGETPNMFIRNIRLRKAAEMLKNSSLTVAEIAYLTGFNQSHYFIKCFRELFNETPKNYRKQHKENKE